MRRVQAQWHPPPKYNAVEVHATKRNGYPYHPSQAVLYKGRGGRGRQCPAPKQKTTLDDCTQHNAQQVPSVQRAIRCHVAQWTRKRAMPPPHMLFVQGAGAENGVLTHRHYSLESSIFFYFLHHILPYTLLLAPTFTRIHQILA